MLDVTKHEFKSAHVFSQNGATVLAQCFAAFVKVRFSIKDVEWRTEPETLPSVGWRVVIKTTSESAGPMLHLYEAGWEARAAFHE